MRNGSICRHPKRSEIDRLVVEGMSYRNITERYGVSAPALSRHRKEHLARLVAGARESERETAQELRQELGRLRDETLEILAKAKEKRQTKVALLAIARAERQIELRARLAEMPAPKWTGGSNRRGAGAGAGDAGAVSGGAGGGDGGSADEDRARERHGGVRTAVDCRRSFAPPL